MSPLALGLVLAATRVPFQASNVETTSHRVELGGNSWAEYTITFEQFDSSGVFYNTCENQCKRVKHLLHEECDTSCDAPCLAVHNKVLRPGPAMERDYSGYQNDLAQFGLSPKSAGHYYNQLAARANAAAESNTWDPGWKDHWNTKPCTTVNRIVHCVGYNILLTVSLFRNDQGPNGTQVLVRGPVRSRHMAQLLVPKHEYEEAEHVGCRCSVVSDGGIEEEDEYGIAVEESDGGSHEISGGEEQQVGLSLECTSMTECVATFVNPTLGDISCKINPGAVFECVDGSAQDEVCMDSLKVDLGPMERKSVPVVIDGNTWEPVSVKGRFGCLNMEKKEPARGIKYRYGGQSPNPIRKLAQATAKSSFKGVADQVRLWIVTDKASRDQIGKRLLPPPSRSMYVRSLFEISSLCNEDFADSSWDACLDPVNVAGGLIPPEATDWFVRTWSRRNPKKFAAQMASAWTVLTAECLGEKSEPRHVKHVADLASSLSHASAPEVKALAFDCLMKGVPAEKREAVIEAGGLSAMDFLLSTGSAEQAAKALDVYEAYGHRGTGLLNCGKHLPDEIKARAASLYEKLAP